MAPGTASSSRVRSPAASRLYLIVGARPGLADLLEERGADEASLREHGEEIERLRARLAALVRESGDGAYSAAA